MSPFKQTLVCTAACALLAACGGGTTGDAAQHERAAAVSDAAVAVPDEIVVKLLDANALQPLLAEFGLTLLDQFGARPIYRLRAAPGSDTEALAARLAADARVQYAEPNLLHQTPEGRTRRVWAIGGDAGTYATQWNAQALRLGEAHGIATGSGVIVAVLDSGIDAAHPALAGRVIGGFDFVDNDTDPSEQGRDGDPGYGHGTHVASLVAQVAPQARILPLRVLEPSGAGNIWVLAEALLHAVDPDGVPITNDGAQVINLSLGTTRPTSLLADIVDVVSCEGVEDDDDEDDEDENPVADEDAARCAASGGAVVVSAAGNSGDETAHYPAAEQHEGALAVAASSQGGALASFSTRGSWVPVAAPGDAIYGAIPGGRWAVWSGTSMAAPMVAGAAALLRSHFPQWPAREVANQLRSQGRQLCASNIRQIDPVKALNGSSGPGFACP
jgi:subtilisin family serine protease